MIVKPRYLGWMAVLTLGVLLCTGGTGADTPTSQDWPTTLELKRLVAANPELKRLLIASIEGAKQINPDRLTNPAQSLEQYLAFVAWAERAIPANLLKAKPDATSISVSIRASPTFTSLSINRLTSSKGAGTSTTPYNTRNLTVPG